MRIRHANKQDIPRILRIYAAARDFMHRSGNPTQWPDDYPGHADVAADMRHSSLYVCEMNEEVLAVFFFAMGPDPTYAHIDGSWLNDEPYGVVHRIAAQQGSGAGRTCIEWACAQVPNLRIDTHEHNAPMRHVLNKLGFAECGTIICEDGTPRVAYHYVR
ncbi:MAG: GNAT family N-acetyltransferase [Atopobiaceae bacterium]|nr:GNAT family N-acetyltransferase [Atopobiaceae bacterium]